MSTVIKVENLSKQYRLGNVGSGSLKDDLTRWWNGMRGKEDPLLQIGDTNDRSQKADSDYVWALKDINFEVQQGDVLGIIGRNGAGKSTLLKILSKTTAPTTGNVKVKGRIASLLEVGTGFHPELTGRENIYLNGAILGMRKHEITRKLDEIIDFAGVERYIDTPVKRYSSGMYVRLAFGVAAHLESEILIIDEVLAVGDAEFQKKCLGKMSDVSKGEGRTVLFVSHNIAAINKLCNKAILLKDGLIKSNDIVNNVIRSYSTIAGNQDLNNNSIKSWNKRERPGNNMCQINSISIEQNNTNTFNIDNEYEFLVKINYEINANIDDFSISLNIVNDRDDIILHTADIFGLQSNTKYPRKKGIFKTEITIPKRFLNIGDYYVNVSAEIPGKLEILYLQEVLKFSIYTSSINTLKYDNAAWKGCLSPESVKINIIAVND
jgi:lipopolysaccharide transport system ATP-binding protein